ncbi:MAG: 4Fe-4S binding protein [Desulfofustis sp.]|nr:4Fe-4S binding protein [Desulfofustis sp.]
MEITQTVKHWLETGFVDIFLGYRLVDGHHIPHGYTRENLSEVDQMVGSETRYSLEQLATRISSRHPQATIGMLARDCSKRAVNVLVVWNQLDKDRIKTIDVNCCPSPLNKHADCSYLDSEQPGSFKIRAGIAKNAKISGAEENDQHERLARWMYEFQKCIKCYGCRNICPVCFCKECSLEHPDLVHSGRLPPDVPIFHLVRATHMAGRCIDCGLCEQACPMDIPLRLLYRKVNQIVSDVFDYDTGTSAEQSPFSVLGEKVTLTPKPLNAS